MLKASGSRYWTMKRTRERERTKYKKKLGISPLPSLSLVLSLSSSSPEISYIDILKKVSSESKKIDIYIKLH